MSFDMVINCDLRENTPEELCQAIHCLTQIDYELKETPAMLVPGIGNVWDYFSDYHFLAPDPERGTISNFRRFHRLTIPAENHREVHRYRLQYCGSVLHDDYFYSHHLLFVYWLATVAYDNYIGYYGESHNEGGITDLIVESGTLREPT